MDLHTNKADTGSAAKGRLLFIWMSSLLIGYFGGWVALQNSNQALISSSQQIVLQESEVIANVAETVSPSVVSINVTSTNAGGNGFFGSRTFESDSEGTGIILSADGLVVTNRHVIPESTSSVSLELTDGTVYDNVSVVGRDPFNDIAFLQIEGVNGLQPAVLADSSTVRVGDKVVAIGNALGQFDTTVTSGIISGLGRPIIAGNGLEAEQLQNLFQTDTAINPGNSGGPLLNINGEVIGINTAVSGEGQNIGFSIPINDVKPGIASVEKNGELIRPYLGIRYVTVTNSNSDELDAGAEQGALITADPGQSAILNDSPAQKAGLQQGDVIIRVQDIELTDETPLVTTISMFEVGETVTLLVVRDGQEQEIALVLEAAPENL